MSDEKALRVARAYLADITFAGWADAELFVRPTIGSTVRVLAKIPGAQSVINIHTRQGYAASDIANGRTYYE